MLVKEEEEKEEERYLSGIDVPLVVGLDAVGEVLRGVLKGGRGLSSTPQTHAHAQARERAA